MLVRCELNENLYHPDGFLGLSFIGNLAFEISLMLCSGWLFAPLIIINTHRIGYLLLSIYMTFTVVSLAIPISLVHTRLIKIKRKLVECFYLEANLLYNETTVDDI